MTKQTWDVISETAVKKNLDPQSPDYWHTVTLNWIGDKPYFRCTCKGFGYNNRCRHITHVLEHHADEVTQPTEEFNFDDFVLNMPED